MAESPKFVVAHNTNYYNDVVLVDSREAADALVAEWMERARQGGMGQHYDETRAVIVVAHIVSIVEMPDVSE